MNLDSISIDTSKVTIVFPDETKSKKQKGIVLEDTPSGRFAITLQELFRIDYIAIPRLIIDDSENFLNNIENFHKELWFAQLREVSENLVIIDEVNISGGTFKSILSILSSLDKHPICYFPILDLNPNITKKFRVFSKAEKANNK